MNPNPIIASLVESVLFSMTDDDGGPLDKNYTINDIDEKSLEKLYQEYSEFISEVEKGITDKIGCNWNSIDEFYDMRQPVNGQTEHDYVMTRNYQGCGFGDGDWSSEVSQILVDAARKKPEFCAVIGDDEKIYFV